MEEAIAFDEELEKIEKASAKRRTIYINKLFISTNIIQWENFLIKSFTEYVDGINKRMIREGKESEFEIWNICWRWILWLFFEIKNNKLESLKDKNEEEYEVLSSAVEKRIKSLPLTHQDLVDSFNAITKFISLAGYHDDTFSSKEGTLEEEEW